MKKILALLLALAMVFSFAACGSSETATETATEKAEAAPATETTAAAETVTDAVEEVLADEEAGEDGYFIGFSALMTGNEQVMLIVNAITEYLESQGCEVQLTDANGDLPTQISHIENFATMGADLVIIISLDMDTLYEACINAEKAGTKCFFFGMKPDYVDEIAGCTAVSYFNIGWCCAEMLLLWVEENYPDAASNPVPVAVSAMDSYADGKAINEGFAAKLEEDGRAYVDYYENLTEMTSEDGYNFMQNALTYNPDYKLFFCYNTGISLGMDEYLISNGYDLSQMCIIGDGEVSYAAEQVESSKTNESAFRGYIGYGASDMGAYMGGIVLEILAGTRETGNAVYDPLYAVSAFDYEVSADRAGG